MNSLTRPLTPQSASSSLIALSLLLIPLPSLCAQQPGSAKVDLELQDASVADALEAVMRQSRQVLDADCDVDGPITLSLRETPWRDAVAAIASAARCEVEQRDGWLRLYHGPRVSYRCDDADVRGVLLELARRAKRSVVLAPDATGRVSVDFDQLPYSEALAQTVAAASLRATSVDGCAVVSRGALPTPSVPPRASAGLEALEALQRTVPVDLRDVALRDALDQLGRALGLNLVCEPGVDARVTLVLPAGAPAHAVLRAIARRCGCEVFVLAPGVLYFERRTLEDFAWEGASAEGVLLDLSAYAGVDLFLCPDVRQVPRVSLEAHGVDAEVLLRAITRALGLQVARSPEGFVVGVGELPAQAPSWELPEGGQGRCDLQAEGLQVAEAVVALEEAWGGTILVDPNVDGEVSFALRGVTWQEALQVILRQARCVAEPVEEDAVVVSGYANAYGGGLLRAYGAPLCELLQLVGARSGQALVCDPALRGRVSVNVAVTPRSLARFAEAYGLTLTPGEGEAVRVGWSAKAEQLLREEADDDPPLLEERAWGEPWDPAEVASTCAQIEADFVRLDALGERLAAAAALGPEEGALEREALEEALSEIQQRFGELPFSRGAWAYPLGLSACARWEARLLAHGEVLKPETSWVLGAVTLTGVVSLIEDERYEEALALADKVAPIVAGLLAREEAACERVGHMLSLRTKQLSERARRYAEISRIPLRVSAVFCVKDPAACGAILNGRLLRPGDRFEDPVTKHVVQVCEVSYSSVILDYEGTKFVRGVR